jgi:MFS family permease
VSRYAIYAIAVITAANFLNYVDRNILSILAQSIKADLRLDDTQLGFLLGTAFAVFYAVVGVSIGRIADAVDRTRLMALGLLVWSVMTTLGAAATGFASLSATRIGVAVGEAAATPCGHSLVTQYAPQRARSTALGVFIAGTYGGVAAAMLLGGLILQRWASLCRFAPVGGACRLASWKAAFVVVGLPGLLVAIAVAALREPPRQGSGATPLPRLLASELGANIPPFTLVALYRLGGLPLLGVNLAIAAALVAVAAVLTRLTGDLVQWAAIALGAYSVASWAQGLSRRDAPLFQLTFGCPTYQLLLVCTSLLNCASGAIQAWAAPFAIRTHHMSPAGTGFSLGLTFAAGALAGVLVGGWVNDRWKRTDPRAPAWMAMMSLAGLLPCAVLLLHAATPQAYVAAFFGVSIFSSWSTSASAALVQDLVLSRMRGTAIAAMTLVNVVVSAGLGPYLAGKVSTLTGSLATGLLAVQALAPAGFIFLLFLAARLRRDGAEGRLGRSEPVPVAPAA